MQLISMETVVKTIHKFQCKRCNRKAVSVKLERAEQQLCRICRSQKIPPGQKNLFDDSVTL